MGSFGEGLNMTDTTWQQDEFPKMVENARKQRDLYLEMKRLENPDFSFIPIQDLRSALNTAPQVKKVVKKPKHYQCVTQQNDSLDELFLGLSRGNITIWENGSVINWIARQDGYPSQQHAMDAAVATHRAAQQWNEAMDGRVTFRYVTRFDDAAFQLVYGGNRGGVLASAFFPDMWGRSLNIVFINQLQFSPQQKPLIVNTMLHELGHVLGLRHEHSHSGIPGFLPPEDTANGAESIIFGVRNPKSVMAYYEGQTIQDSDVVSIRLAYDEMDDGKVIAGKGRFGIVRKTISRVEPNN